MPYNSVIIGVLSSLVFEKRYKNLNEDQILMLINFLSGRVRLPISNLSIHLGFYQVYLYLATKFYKQEQMYNDKLKKIKGKIEDDIKPLLQFLESMFTEQSRDLDLSRSYRCFVILFIKLLAKSPLLFKLNIRFLETLL